MTDYQGSGDAVPGDQGLDCGVSRRKQGHDGIHGRTKHAY